MKWLGRDIKILPVDQIELDPAYQRALVKSAVAKMTGEGFNPAALRGLVVSRRANGKYFVLDGQHRLVAMRKAGIAKALCEVHTGLTRKQEARLFVVLNASKYVQPKNKFQANLFAGCEVEVEINRLVTEHGFVLAGIGVLSKGRPKTGVHVIKTVKVLQDIRRLYKAAGLRDTLYVLKEAFEVDGFISPNALKDQFIQGVADYLGQNDCDRDELVELLQGVDADSLWEKALGQARWGQAAFISRHIQVLARRAA